ncbi:2,3-dihydro-2,3-dihydroxybenzoate dehydrogenase [Chitinivorax sp. B]|uniref:2,3-dihydro-2,3-dihydroxybenzoate dehydrogenase n=1 Tax=Chitinivorax sp. B TaxID=2502235 RepID=UPI0010F9F97A|nr:2,3-dihydro-2,3-dihydroxybenzoate dehydrogenase [Chitinivorax sp. B]
MEFTGKIALISGAAQGIGAAVAHALAAGGAYVALLDHQADKLEMLATDLQAHGHQALAIPADLTQSDQIKAAVDRVEHRLGPIDILVNVAGVLRMAPILDVTDEDWHTTFAVNTNGLFQLSQSVARRMVPRRRGVVITVGSNAASVPRTQMAAYCASKAASAQFTKCLGLELAQFGIRCNIVSPGSTDTNMQRMLWTGPEGPAAVLRGSLEQHRLGIPLQRIANATDIADAVCFLASDRARHITLHDLRVDGGATLDA